MKEIIQGCKRHDRIARGNLYERYKNQVFRTAFLLTRSDTMSDDITQETFIRVFEKIKQFDDTQPFEPWLYRVTLNVAKNMLRKKEIIQLFRLGYDERQESPLEYVVRQESEEMLWERIKDLPFKQQSVIVLKYMNGFSQEEIADILQIPLGTVKSRLHNALQKLKRRLAQEHQEIIKEVLCDD
jgi:RNA polymerase sigma-70 factor (ECF subfamily)